MSTEPNKIRYTYFDYFRKVDENQLLAKIRIGQTSDYVESIFGIAPYERSICNKEGCNIEARYYRYEDYLVSFLFKDNRLLLFLITFEKQFHGTVKLQTIDIPNQLTFNQLEPSSDILQSFHDTEFLRKEQVSIDVCASNIFAWGDLQSYEYLETHYLARPGRYTNVMYGYTSEVPNVHADIMASDMISLNSLHNKFKRKSKNFNVLFYQKLHPFRKNSYPNVIGYFDGFQGSRICNLFESGIWRILIGDIQNREDSRLFTMPMTVPSISED